MNRTVFAAVVCGLAVGLGCAVVDGVDLGGYELTAQKTDGGADSCSPNGTACPTGLVCCSGACVAQGACNQNGACTTDSQCPSGQVCGTQPGCTGTSCATACTAPFASLNAGQPYSVNSFAAFRTTNPADGGIVERVLITDADAGCDPGGQLNPIANSQSFFLDLYQATGPGIDAGSPAPTVGQYQIVPSTGQPTQNLAAHFSGVFFDGACTRYPLARFEGTGGTANITRLDSANANSSVVGSMTYATAGSGSGQNASFAVPGCAVASIGTTCQKPTGSPEGTASAVAGPGAFTPVTSTTQRQPTPAPKALVTIGKHAAQCGAWINLQAYQNDTLLMLSVWNETPAGATYPTATGTYNIVSTTPTPLGQDAAAGIFVTGATCQGSGNFKATGGTVTITSISPAGALSGSYDLIMSGQSVHTTGTFSSGWCGFPSFSGDPINAGRNAPGGCVP